MKTRSYLILMAAAILIPVLIFSGLGIYLTLKQERESRLRIVEETARATALAIDQEIADAEGALRILANTSFIGSGDFDSLHQLMTTGNKSKDTWTVLLDVDGKILAHTLFPLGTSFPLSGYTWLAGVYEQQKPYVSDLRIGAVSKVQVVSVSVPVPTSAGKKYVLNQTFRSDHFNQLLAPRRMPGTWIVGVFDSKGISIARNKDASRLIGKPVSADLYRASLKAASGRTRHVTRENIAVYSVFTHTARTGWTVAIGVPESEIESAARQAVAYTAAALGIVLVLTSLGVFIMVRRLTKAVASTESAAKALGAGKIPQVSKSSVAELDLLQAALRDAGLALSTENAARRNLEQERERLLTSERQARLLAEEQNKAKDEFLAMLGHELRNPLGAISSALTIMSLPGASAEQHARAREIAQRQSDHLSNIVNDLLDVGRVMAGKIQLSKQSVELGKFVQHCVDSHVVNTDSHRWQVTVEEVWVHADPTRLEQIVGNVLANAIRYTPAGGAIEVDVRPEGDDAVIRIRDTGVGIGPDLLPRIFDVFVQGPTSIDRAQGGLGLGLALVKRLLALHGGTASAASDGPGTGSTFTLRLPRQHAGADGELAADLSAGTALKPEQAGQHVLVVEDNDEGREMLVTVLALHGFRVSGAASGVEALRIVETERPAIAIVDIGLPDMTGHALAERLQSQPSTRHIRLIALTGYGQKQDRQRALQAGFAAHVAKPYDIDQLLALLAAEPEN